MTFLNPLLLLGLVAAAIPLIIHLFNFRRPRRVDFSSLAFVKELQKSTMQRVRIKQWLLLVLRTLAIACLVLAFARPTLTGGLAGTFGGRASSSLAVVLDNSLSMTLRDAQGEYMEQARSFAAAVVDQTAQGDELFVLTTAGDASATPPAYQNRSPALDAVASAEVQIGASTTTRAVGRAGALLAESAHLNREVYVISDLQASTFADSAAVAVPEDVRIYLLPVGDRLYGNVAVTDVRVASRIIESGQPARVEATLVNHGAEPVEDYVASLFLDGERVAQAAADLAPGAQATVTFTVTPQQRGWLSGVVRIEDDAFEHDNVRYFTVNVPERRRVLIVRGEGASTRYVELALSPQLTEGRVAFDLETIPETALAATSLGAYDAVVLAGARTLSSGEVAALTRYMEEGGGLLFFPNEGAAAADYNALFAGMGGGTFSGFSGGLGEQRVIASFDRVDLEHPLFEGVFGQQAARAGASVERPDVYHAMNYTPAAGNEQTLIRLSSGQPFLQEIRHGRGAAFLVAVAPDEQWSDLPVRGLFVPLMYRAMYYLASSESVAGEQLTVGEGGELRLAGVADAAQPLRLAGPDGDEFTPEQRNVFGALLLRVPPGAARQPGIYDVRAGDRLVRRVAFNLDSRESDLAVLDPDAAAAQLADATGAQVHVLDVAGQGLQQVVQALQEQRTGVEIWNVFLMLALMFLVAEMVVARQWRPETVAA